MEISVMKKKQMQQERLSGLWEPTTLLAVRLSLGKHKAVLIKSLPYTLKSSLLRRSGAKECKLVVKPTLKFWQIRSKNTRLFQLNKYLLSCCYVQQGTTLGSAEGRKMNNVQMPLTWYLAESLAPLHLHLLPSTRK